jgi:hypothetical protein
MLNEFQYFPDQLKNLLKKSLDYCNGNMNSKDDILFRCEFVLFSEEKSYLRFK